jgi:hypothetical protein
MKKREKGGNEKIKGGEMQKKKKRGKLESVARVYLMHAANWTRGFITRGYLFFLCNLPRCHQDTWPIGRVATVTATVDTLTVATRQIAAFFVVIQRDDPNKILNIFNFQTRKNKLFQNLWRSVYKGKCNSR